MIEHGCKTVQFGHLWAFGCLTDSIPLRTRYCVMLADLQTGALAFERVEICTLKIGLGTPGPNLSNNYGREFGRQNFDSHRRAGHGYTLHLAC